MPITANSELYWDIYPSREVPIDADSADSPQQAQAKGKGSAATPALAYKVLVRLDRQNLQAGGEHLHLSAGMQVIAEINEGKRTVLEYLLSPIKKTFDEAGHER